MQNEDLFSLHEDGVAAADDNSSNVIATKKDTHRKSDFLFFASDVVAECAEEAPQGTPSKLQQPSGGKSVRSSTGATLSFESPSISAPSHKFHHSSPPAAAADNIESTRDPVPSMRDASITSPGDAVSETMSPFEDIQEHFATIDGDGEGNQSSNLSSTSSYSEMDHSHDALVMRQETSKENSCSPLQSPASPLNSASSLDKAHSHYPDSSSEWTQKKFKELTTSDISKVLAMGLTQEKAAHYFGVSLSTFKRRLRALDIKWPRGKKQKERVGVGSMDSTKVASSIRKLKKEHDSKKQKDSAHEVKRNSKRRHTTSSDNNEAYKSQTGFIPRKRIRRSSTSEPYSLNSKLQEVIQNCQDIIDAESSHCCNDSSASLHSVSSPFEQSAASSLSPQSSFGSHSSQPFYSATYVQSLAGQRRQQRNPSSSLSVLGDTSLLQHIYKRLQQRNASLRGFLERQNQMIIELKKELQRHEVPTDNNMDLVFRGHVSNIQGPWHHQLFHARSGAMPAIGVLDRNLRLVAANERWADMMGYSMDEFNVVGGFSTYHAAWPRAIDYSTALSVMQPLLEQNEMRRIHVVGLFLKKDGTPFRTRSVFHIGNGYFWEELLPHSEECEQLVFENDDSTQRQVVKKSHLSGRSLDNWNVDDVLTECILTFGEIIKFSNQIKQRKHMEAKKRFEFLS